MAARQYITVHHLGDYIIDTPEVRVPRPFTYHNDGPALKEGDRIRVRARNGGEGDEVTVVVVQASPIAPVFATSAILGKAK